MARLYALPPGADVAAGIARGLAERLAGEPPEVWARTLVFVPTARLRQGVIAALAQGARLLPRVRLIGDLAAMPLPGARLPPAVPPLRRRLELAGLIAALLDRAPDLAPRSALFDLADSLAALVAEMQEEGVPPDRLAALDTGAHAAHWQRTAAFLRIVAPFFDASAAPDEAARQRLAVAALGAHWVAHPPQAPVVVAGSTGSRGVTLELMAAVAGLEKGMVILPGFDPDLPAQVWEGMTDSATGEDHPQFRFRRLFDRLGCRPEAVRLWAPAPDPARNALVSLALRPAPVTDQWLVEGAGLPDLVAATGGMTLIEAPDPRAEAGAIALVLRRAAEEAGTRAVLVTADRTLARRVTAALDRWGIRPDDSAGRPLSLSAPGRFLRMTAALGERPPTAEALLALLNHPLAASGGDRGRHLRLTRALELRLRRHGPPYPDARTLIAFAADQEAEDWGRWLAGALAPRPEAPLAAQLDAHLALTAGLAAGPGAEGSGRLWEEAAGIEARAAMRALQDAAGAMAAPLSPADYTRLLDSLFSTREVRDTAPAHPRIMIRGTREVRAQGAELMILAGLNEGGWPALPGADPWLNRAMRQAAGLLLPERQIGLSAHDFQMAAGAPRVVLTRAARDDEAQTVPARWLNRLTNLMQGLPEKRGPQALAMMRERGREWLALAAAVEHPGPPVPRAPRPAPAPPVEARPQRLSVTEIKTLIRDPYAIYARHVLGLRPLDPLRMEADARLRGMVLHAVLERFVRETPAAEPREAALLRLSQTAAMVLAAEVPWPAACCLWQARIDRAAPVLLDWTAAMGGRPLAVETPGLIALESRFMLSGRPDRIDELPDGRLRLIDYKTGKPPNARVQEHFDKQLLLLAMMAEDGGFTELGPRAVASVVYLGLGASPEMAEVAVTPDLMGRMRTELAQLIDSYRQPRRGFPSRRAMQWEDHPGDYDHLARLGEWETTDPAVTLPVGLRDG